MRRFKYYEATEFYPSERVYCEDGPFVDSEEMMALEASHARLVKALEQSAHALMWSEPKGGETCDSPVSDQEAAVWYNDAVDGANEALAKAKALTGEAG